MTTPDAAPTAPISTPAKKPGSNLYIRTADAMIAGGGLLMFLFSFAPFVSFDGVTVAGYHEAGFSRNAWTYVAPVVLFVVFAAIALIASAFIDTFWHREKQVVGLHRHIVQVGLALYALITLVGFALNGNGFSWGGIFMLLGAIVAAAGAVLNHFGLLQNPLEMPAGKPKQTPSYQGGVYGNPAPPQQGYAPQGYAPQAPQQGYPQPGQQAPGQPVPGQPQQGYVPPAPTQAFPTTPQDNQPPTA